MASVAPEVDAADDSPRVPRARAVALYLPQFYPTPENSMWWGPGFTEWTNVVRAAPLFEGHYAPRLPTSLGFYDLRMDEVRERQAELARAHGIEAFCYWHYWFHGRRLLSRPFEEVLASGSPDFPFCLAWANQTWSRRWHGSGETDEVLIEQTYSPEDDVEHARYLARAFADERYLTVDGRALFVIYAPFDLPEPRRTTDTIREIALGAGLKEPYLVGLNLLKPDADTRPLGFDRTVNYQPIFTVVPGAWDKGLKIYDYTIAVRNMLAQERDYPFHPAMIVSWDNTPRRGEEGIVLINSTPDAFRRQLDGVVQSMADEAPQSRLLFLNAWNEWAEGNYLEPDDRYGLDWLRAVRSVLLGA
jgi:lipopolysaccharide biosynthesis protein